MTETRKWTYLRNAGADLASGLVAFGLLAARLGHGAVRILAAGLWATISRAPSPLGLVRAGGSALLYAGAAALALNIWFISGILPRGEVDLWTVNRPASLTILDREGGYLGTRGSLYADPVPLTAMPPYLRDAFIATEDRRFYEHKGFDLRGLTRAMLANYRAKAVVQGGSTITQQLAKNLFLETNRTILRKLEELQLAFWLEARLSKDEILSLYLNRTYLGGGTYGVAAASKFYFGKTPTELTLGEAAMLAGLPKAPSTLAPSSNFDAALVRSHEVLDNLLDVGKVDPVAAEMARKVPPKLNLAPAEVAYGHFLDHVLTEVTDRFGELTDDVVVTTTLDPRLQALAENAVHAVIDKSARRRKAEEAAMIVFDNEGGIVAMVGGLDYAASQFNRATSAMRQPGSAFKTIVFLAALEAGLSPESIVVDRAVRVGTWEPTNYDEKHRGAMRLSTALARSINTVSVQVTEAIGRERVIDAAQRVGISTPLAPHASIALGSVEITLAELAGAYLPIAHHGHEVPPHAVMAVRSRRGTPIYAFAPIDGFRVIETAHADNTLRMLQHVVKTGTGKAAAIEGQEVAGKTGTSNDWRDAWFVGVTPYYLGGVWVGNDRFEAMDKIAGGTLPLEIWHRFMAEAHVGLEPAVFFEDAPELFEDAHRLRNYYYRLRRDLRDVADPDWRLSYEHQGGVIRGEAAPEVLAAMQAGNLPAAVPVPAPVSEGSVTGAERAPLATGPLRVTNPPVTGAPAVEPGTER